MKKLVLFVSTVLFSSVALTAAIDPIHMNDDVAMRDYLQEYPDVLNGMLAYAAVSGFKVDIKTIDIKFQEKAHEQGQFFCTVSTEIQFESQTQPDLSIRDIEEFTTSKTYSQLCQDVKEASITR